MTAALKEAAPYACQCCPSSALAALTADELAALDRWCARALDDPDAEPSDDERPAVERYEALLAERARALQHGRTRQEPR